MWRTKWGELSPRTSHEGGSSVTAEGPRGRTGTWAGLMGVNPVGQGAVSRGPADGCLWPRGREFWRPLDRLDPGRRVPGRRGFHWKRKGRCSSALPQQVAGVGAALQAPCGGTRLGQGGTRLDAAAGGAGSWPWGGERRPSMSLTCPAQGLAPSGPSQHRAARGRWAHGRSPAPLPRRGQTWSRRGPRPSCLDSGRQCREPECPQSCTSSGRSKQGQALLWAVRASCSPAPAACCRRLRPVSCSGARGHGGAEAAPSPPRSFRRAQAAARVLSRCSPRGSIGRFLCLPDQMLHLWHRQRLLRHGAAWLRNAHLAGAQLGQLPVSARPPAPRPARAQAPRQAGERGARPLPFAWPASRAAA